MLASLLVVFREVFEAGLIVGLVLAASEGVARRGRYVWGGIAAGLVGACLVAGFAGALSTSLSGVGPEVFNASVLIIATLMLSWHSLWMARHAREMAAEMQALGRAVASGERSLPALAIVIAVAVLREGSEVALFLYGIAAGSTDGPVPLAVGGVIGLAGGIVTAWLLYRGLVIIPTRHFFKVTNLMIAFLAAGMAGQAAAYLVSADILPSWGDAIWNTSGILPETDWLGRALHALVGYSAQPSGLQCVVYAAVLATLILGGRMVASPRPRAAAPVGRGGLTRASVLLLVIGGLGLGSATRADEPIVLTIKDHRFQPEKLEVPTGVKVKVIVRNLDATAEEFESTDLNREKVVPAGGEVPISLGPLGKGVYRFFGDFHQDTAQGVLVAN